MHSSNEKPKKSEPSVQTLAGLQNYFSRAIRKAKESEATSTPLELHLRAIQNSFVGARHSKAAAEAARMQASRARPPSA